VQGEADQLLLQALVVNISSATNADVDAGCAATVVSESTQADLAVTFTAGVNEVCAVFSLRQSSLVHVPQLLH
jgi:hypothetical protein